MQKRTLSRLITLFTFTGVITTGCANGLPQRDLGQKDAAATGYIVDAESAKARGGIGLYVPRICSDGGWGAPAADCSVASVVTAKNDAVQAPVADSKPATTTAIFTTEDGSKPSIRLNLNFETGSAALIRSELAESELNNVAEALKKHPDIAIRIEGYTDNRGDNAKNVALSEKRADAVREDLLNRGVSANQVAIKGFGSAQPVAPNSNAAGRAKNRRVMAVVTTQ